MAACDRHKKTGFWPVFLHLERVMGIEPTALAWEARVLPLYDTRLGQPFYQNSLAK